MKKFLFSLFCLSLGVVFVHAQSVGINTDGSAPDPSSILDVKATNKGVLVPRLTTLQRSNIVSPAAGLLVYDTDTATFWFYNGATWTSLLIAETDPEVSSSTTNRVPKWNGATLTDGAIYDDGTNIGIGTSSPTQTLDVNGTTRTTGLEATSVQTTSLKMTDGATDGYVLKTDASGNASWVAPTSLSITETDPQVSSSTTNRVPKWNGTTLTDGVLVDDGTNIGIGTASPAQKLEIVGTTKTVGFQMPTGAASGYVFQTDASGNASWVAPTSLSITETDPQVSSSTTSRVPRWSGTTLSDGSIFDNGTNVGIGTTSPGQKLDVSGTTKTTNLQMTSGATNGYVLQSDASGNASWVSSSSIATVQTKIQDADADTKIQTEESSDEDKIRFDLGGTQRWLMQSARLEPDNSGHSVFIGESAGAADDLNENYNVGVGYKALTLNTSGAANVAIGREALAANTSGSINVAVGRYAMQKNTTGQINVAVGDGSMLNNQTGNFNAAFGYGALYNNISGSTNVAMGSNALHDATGSGNTALGIQAGYHATGSGNVFIGTDAGTDETGDDKLYIDNSDTDSPLIWGDFSSNYVNINGNLGVGTTTPTQAKLVVNGSQSLNLSYGYLNGSGNTGDGSGTNNYSIYASSRIAATEFNAFSDARIKKVQGRSDSRRDLETLMGIQITDYRLKDSIAKGNTPYKKVIAQQVEQIYPQAVSTITDVVPDIYQLADIQDGRIALTNTLKAGEKVKLIFGERTELLAVTSADAAGFSVNLPDEGKVFVYGREVSDFHTVDYEALSMLNLSATQELLKMINRQNEAIHQQNEAINTLKSENEAMKAANASLKGDVQLIKAALQLNATTTER